MTSSNFAEWKTNGKGEERRCFQTVLQFILGRADFLGTAVFLFHATNGCVIHITSRRMTRLCTQFRRMNVSYNHPHDVFPLYCSHEIVVAK